MTLLAPGSRRAAGSPGSARPAGSRPAGSRPYGDGPLRLELTPIAGKLVLDLTGRSGEVARGLLTRAELQTVLLLIQQESIKGGWIETARAPDAPVEDGDKPLPTGKKRVVN